jgi:hypothetical protein
MRGLRLYGLLALLAVAVLGLANVRSTRGGLRTPHNACLIKIGPNFMYFSGYQPATSRRKFCENIPATGDTIFVLDYAQSEMREMKADFRIVRAVRQAEEEESAIDDVTVAYLPPRVYPSGTLSFEHAFKEKGDYVGIVTVDGPNGEHWISHFSFSVGRLYSPRAPYYLIGVAAVMAGLLLLWGRESDAEAVER